MSTGDIPSTQYRPPFELSSVAAEMVPKAIPEGVVEYYEDIESETFGVTAMYDCDMRVFGEATEGSLITYRQPYIRAFVAERNPAPLEINEIGHLASSLAITNMLGAYLPTARQEAEKTVLKLRPFTGGRYEMAGQRAPTQSIDDISKELVADLGSVIDVMAESGDKLIEQREDIVTKLHDRGVLFVEAQTAGGTQYLSITLLAEQAS